MTDLILMPNLSATDGNDPRLTLGAGPSHRSATELNPESGAYNFDEKQSALPSSALQMSALDVLTASAAVMGEHAERSQPISGPSSTEELPADNAIKLTIAASGSAASALLSSTELTNLRSLGQAFDQKPEMTFLTEETARFTTLNHVNNAQTTFAAEKLQATDNVASAPITTALQHEEKAITLFDIDDDLDGHDHAPSSSERSDDNDAAVTESSGRSKRSYGSYDFPVYGGSYGDSGWSITYTPYDPFMGGYYPAYRPTPIVLPSPEQTRWNDAHSAQSMGTYATVFREVHGRDAHDVDLNFAADTIGNGTSLQQYRWNEAHAGFARQNYANIFQQIHGRPAHEVDINFAADTIGNGTSLQQYRWNEAHAGFARQNWANVFQQIHGRQANEAEVNYIADTIGNGTSLQQHRWNEAHTLTTAREYSAVFQSVHGRNTVDADISFAQQKIGNGASIQQYRWDEAHSEGAAITYANVFQQIHGRPAHESDINFAADTIGNGTSLQQYRWNEAHSEGVVQTYKTMFHDVYGRDAEQTDIDAAADAIANGASLLDYRTELASTPERKQAYRTMIEHVHGRRAQPAEVSRALDAICQGQSVKEYRNILAYSPEAQKTYGIVWEEVHGSKAAQEDIDYASHVIGDIFSLQLYRDIEARTPHATQNLERIYHNVLDRAPTAAEVDTAQSALASGASSGQIRENLAYSSVATAKLTSIMNQIGEYAGRIGLTAETAANIPAFGVFQHAVAGGEITMSALESVAAGIGASVVDSLSGLLGLLWPTPTASNDTIPEKAVYIETPLIEESARQKLDAGSNDLSDAALGNFLAIHSDAADLTKAILDLAPGQRAEFIMHTMGFANDELRAYLIACNSIDVDRLNAANQEHINKFEGLGESRGGPGKFKETGEKFDPVDAAYQERVAGTPMGVSYVVEDAAGKAVKFDGYDAVRHVLLDAKNWTNWPKLDFEPGWKSILEQADRQTRAADGTPIEWILPSKENAEKIIQIFKYKNFDYIGKKLSIVVKP